MLPDPIVQMMIGSALPTEVIATSYYMATSPMVVGSAVGSLPA